MTDQTPDDGRDRGTIHDCILPNMAAPDARAVIEQYVRCMAGSDSPYTLLREANKLNR
jgi:hypothetical protein